MILEPTTQAMIKLAMEVRIASGISIITYPTHACHNPSSGIIVKHHRDLQSPPSKIPDEASDATCIVPAESC